MSKGVSLAPADYADWLADIKARVVVARQRAVLPDTVDSEKVNATGKDGVLTVTIPKQAKAMPRRIQIGG